MALKFLNKKGWHTGSLRNVENVWKAEQKHEAEQKKLEELRKQIHEERERSEFRLLQEQAGLVPRQERLEFLYDSGLAVGKGSSDAGGGGGGGFKALEEALPLSKQTTAGDASSSAPGALFEDKPHSANDAWRKLHSDPLLMIRQREQEALARVRNNPVQMALIRESVEGKKQKEKHKSRDKKEKKDREHHKKQRHDHSKQQKRERSDSEDDITRADRKSMDHEGLDYERHDRRSRPDSDDEASQRDSGRRRRRREKHERSDSEDDITRADRKGMDHKGLDYERHDRRPRPDSDDEASQRDSGRRRRREKEYQNGGTHASRDDHKSKHRRHSPEGNGRSKGRAHSPEGRVSMAVDKYKGDDRRVAEPSSMGNQHPSSQHRRRAVATKMSEEERAARLREMQEDANLHEEQRWKRLKRADENDAREAVQSSNPGGRNFLDAAHRSIYGAEKGGSSTIEESVRRRSHYSQGKFEENAFRR